MRVPAWLAFALSTTALWGVWGALIELPEKAGFPATLGYVVWSLTMVPCALAALRLRRERVERDARSLWLGAAVGLSGAGGQLALFQALRTGPAFIVFPLVSLYPLVTILLSVLLLGERAPRRHWAGVLLALPGMALLSYVRPGDAPACGSGWLLLSMVVLIGWGVQAYAMKLATRTMSAEGLFFYMAASAVLLAPLAAAMTDFTQPINWGLSGARAAAGVHLLNALGALALVHALRDGKAILVVPMTALAPVITIALSLAIYGRLPLAPNAAGMALAALAIYLMAT
jgi:drug/metabolite transporter (DMT)-like permease